MRVQEVSGGILEADAMLAQVCIGFVGIPLKFRKFMVLHL
jgi:hypothetical protein